MFTTKAKRMLALALKDPGVASELEALSSALNGDIVMSIQKHVGTGNTLSARSTAWSYQFEVTIKDAAGNVMTWLNATHTSKVSVGDTSTAGTGAVGSANLVFVNGVAKVTVSGAAVAWVAAETVTVTIANCTINGVTVTGGTYVVTVTA